jgi:soluble lytic murein transglycosylase-like protein
MIWPVTADSIAEILTSLKCPEDRVGPYTAIILQSCTFYRIDWKWVVVCIYHESHFNPSLKSFIPTQLRGDKNLEYAVGLMQIKPSTGMEIATDLREEYAYEKLFDSITNIRWGTYYLAKKLLKYRYDYEKAVRAYTLGCGGLATEPEKADNYWQKVSETYNRITMERSK